MQADLEQKIAPRILLVAPNMPLLEMFRFCLDVPASEAQEFDVEMVSSEKEALSFVNLSIQAQSGYAVVLIGVEGRSATDGWNAALRIWDADPNVQVVLCADSGTKDTETLPELAGSSGQLILMREPYDAAKVLLLIRSLISKWELVKEWRLGTIASKTKDFSEIETNQTPPEDQKRSRVSLKMEAIGRLAAGIAHEINTPTQFVGDNTHFVQNAFLDLIPLLELYARLQTAARQGMVTPMLLSAVDAAADKADVSYLIKEIPKAIEQSLEGVRRVSKIVGAMKEFSHPGTEERSRTDINRAIDSTVTVTTNVWRYYSDMVLDLDPKLPLIPCYPSELNQAILNLIVNASHAIEEAVAKKQGRGTITISTRLLNHQVEIKVVDTGIGIPEEIQGRIFEPFFTTKGVGHGTGQGLAFVQSVVVDKHGGEILVESKVGKGSCFMIRLPIDQQAG